MSNKRLTFDELAQTPEYQKLTIKQQRFVGYYCGGGLTDGHYDAPGAAYEAYKCKTKEIARIMSYSLMANVRIVAAINRHFNAEPIEDFLVMLDRAIRNKKLTMAQLGALKLKCDILGIKTMIPSDHETVEDKLEDLARDTKTKKKAARVKKTADVLATEPSATPTNLKDFL